MNFRIIDNQWGFVKGWAVDVKGLPTFSLTTQAWRREVIIRFQSGALFKFEVCMYSEKRGEATVKAWGESDWSGPMVQKIMPAVPNGFLVKRSKTARRHLERLGEHAVKWAMDKTRGLIDDLDEE